jgi:large subunit ribosomal protein L24
VQTTLLGLAIAFIIALVAALVGPYFIDWNQFRPQFEAEATRVIGAPVRVGGALEARLLPAPSLRLRSVVVGGANDLGKVRADRLDVEFSLGDLMRGQWRATELTINGVALDLGIDRQGRIDWPASSGSFSLGSLAIDRLNLTGRVALHDAASHSTIELNDIAFGGDVRSLAGSVRGDGNFRLKGVRYPFRVSSSASPDGKGTRLHLNIDPGERALTADLEGVLAFDARAPRFDGALILATPASAKADAKADAKAGGVPTPWRVSAKVKADPTGATLEQIDASYGAEERALKLSGIGDIRFGAQPLLHAALSARQLDADRLVEKADDKTAEPIRLLPGLRGLLAAMPQPPLAVKIEFSAEQVMLGGRPLQNIAGELHTGATDPKTTDLKATDPNATDLKSADPKSDAGSWRIDRLDFRAPGSTRVSLSGANAPAGMPNGFKETLDVESSDPDTLMAWLQGRSDIGFRNQKPFRLHGDVSLSAGRIAIDAMKAEIDGGAVSGRIAVASPPAGGSRLDADLKADRLDLDAATAFVRSLAGPQPEWPEQAQVSLDIGRAISAGQEMHPFAAKFGYGPTSVSLDQLKIGDASSVMLQGAGNFNRGDATGRLTLKATAQSLGRINAIIQPFAPQLASRLDKMASSGASYVNLALSVDKDHGHVDRADVRGVLDFGAPQLSGTVTVTAKPEAAALRRMELDKIQRSEFSIESHMSSPQGAPLLALLGLDQAVAPGAGPAQFQGSATGIWHAPLRLKLKLSGAELDTEAQGTAEPWAKQPKANVNLVVRRVNLAPLFGLKPSDKLVQNISLSSRLALAGNKLTLDDLDGTLAGSRLRGHLALTLADEKEVEGEVGLDALDLAPAFALAIGSAGREVTEPLDQGLLKGWRGHVAFQALRGTLPGGGELRPVSGIVKSDGQSLTLDDIKGGIGGGEATASIDAKPGANGTALNARVQLNGVNGAALHYRSLAMPAGRASMQMTLAAEGRSTSGLIGALSGGGTVTLESAAISGLDPHAFEVAINASDSGQVTNDVRLRQIVDPALSAGALLVASAQIPFTIRDGRLRVAATTLDAGGVHAIVSGGYDIPADQADIRATLALTGDGFGAGHPEIQLFEAGSPDRLDRSVDVSALSSWLAVRAIDRETRRLDSIERGEQPQAMPTSVPPPAIIPPKTTPPDTALQEQPSSNAPASNAPSSNAPVSDVPTPSRNPRRIPLRPKASAPRPVPTQSAPAPPVLSQQVAPLPPPIEIRPAPGAVRPPPRPRLAPPLTLTPQVTTPQ